jgi:site-specific recombinase XerD
VQFSRVNFLQLKELKNWSHFRRGKGGGKVMEEEYTELLDQFLKHRKIEGYKDEYHKKQHVKVFMEYLCQNDLRLSDVRFKEAQSFQGYLIEYKNKSLASGTIHNYIKSAIAFYEYLKKKGVVYVNPFREIKRKRVEKKLPRDILKEAQMELLLKKMEEEAFNGTTAQKRVKYRLHVLAELLYSTGLRISEAADIKIPDIDFVHGTIKVKDVKDGHEKIVFLNEYAKEVLQLYVTELRMLVFIPVNSKELLFGVTGIRLKEALNDYLKEITVLLKLPAISTHGFRHAVGYHLLKAGCPVRIIQEILSHKYIRSTEVYTKVDKEDLKEVLDFYHPRNFRKEKKDE